VFDAFSDGGSQDRRKRLLASMAGAGVFYVVLGAGAVSLVARFATDPPASEPELEVKFAQRKAAPPTAPPPPPPPSAVVAPPPPLPPPISQPRQPDKPPRPPPKRVAAPRTVPDLAPAETDPSHETGPPPSDNPGQGDPFGQRNGRDGPPPDAPPSAPSTAPAGPIILPPGATAPEPVDPKARPPYPPGAREARFTGEVVVKVIVRADGTVEVVKVMKSDPNFDATVLEFLKTYRFKPAIYNGNPVAVYRNLRFPFTLD